MKTIYKILLSVILSINFSYSQVTTSIDDVLVNSQTTVTSCNTIDIGTTSNNSLNFFYKLQKSSASYCSNGNLKIMLKYSSSTYASQRGADIIIQSTSWDSNNIAQGYISCNFSAIEVQVSGSTIYLEYIDCNNNKTRSCEYPIIKTPPPSFSLSPNSLSISCNEISPKIFTVTPANIPPGANVSYNWSNIGWSLVSSTVNTRTLQPTSGTSLPSAVSVTPYINGVAQPILICQVSRATFNPILTISGNPNLCLGSNSIYSITGLGSNTVSWSSSNTTVATISSATQSQVTVNAVSEGTVTLIATISNTCNQNVTKSFTINIGRAKIANYQILGGYDNVPVGSSSIFNVTAAVGVSSYAWSIIPMNTTCVNSSGLPLSGVILPSLSSNGLLSRTVQWGNCAGLFIVRCAAQNACGGAFYSDKVVTVFNPTTSDPCAGQLVLTPNPFNKSLEGLLISIAQPIDVPPCDNTLLRSSSPTIKEIQIFDLQNNLFFSEKNNNLKNVKQVKNLDLVKGIYIVKVTTSNDEILLKKLIVE